MNGSIKSQMGYIIQQINGIGQSKATERNNSDLRDITNQHAVSGLVHSYRYKDEVFKTGVALGEFAKSEFNIKDMLKINGEIVKAFIESKITDGISRNTAKDYLAHLAKIEIALEKVAQTHNKEYQAFNRDDLKDIRETVLNLEKNQHINRSYENPEKIINHLSEKYQIVAQLQLKYGLRVTEAAHITQKQLNDNLLTIQGKGGYHLTKELSQDIINKIKENMIDDKFTINPNAYRQSLARACNRESENYHGSHGLRYNYAQNTYLNKYSQNLKNGMPDKDAHNESLQYTSEQLGHHRNDITLVYLS